MKVNNHLYIYSTLCILYSTVYSLVICQFATFLISKLKNHQNLSIRTEPLTADPDATVYVWLLFLNISGPESLLLYTVASARIETGQFLFRDSDYF